MNMSECCEYKKVYTVSYDGVIVGMCNSLAECDYIVAMDILGSAMSDLRVGYLYKINSDRVFV